MDLAATVGEVEKETSGGDDGGIDGGGGGGGGGVRFGVVFRERREKII